VTAQEPRFEWPPKAPRETEAAAESASARPVRRRSALARLIEDTERVFVGVPGGMLADRIDRAVAEQPEACWRCGGEVGPGESDGEGCSACRNERPHWDAFVRLGLHDGELRELVHDVKFTRWRSAGTALGRELGRLILARPEIEALVASGRPGLIVPAPMSRIRRFVRGIDHTRCIARGIRGVLGWPIAGVLSRRHGPSQTEVAASRRAENVRDMFGIRREVPAEVGAVVVVDDVRTTGATLGAACRAVRQAARAGRDVEAEAGRLVVIGAAVSVALDPRRRGQSAENRGAGAGGDRPERVPGGRSGG